MSSNKGRSDVHKIGKAKKMITHGQSLVSSAGFRNGLSQRDHARCRASRVTGSCAVAPSAPTVRWSTRPWRRRRARPPCRHPPPPRRILPTSRACAAPSQTPGLPWRTAARASGPRSGAAQTPFIMNCCFLVERQSRRIRRRRRKQGIKEEWGRKGKKGRKKKEERKDADALSQLKESPRLLPALVFVTSSLLLLSSSSFFFLLSSSTFFFLFFLFLLYRLLLFITFGACW